MSRLILAVVVTTLFSPVLAKSENSSVGTKELLERIEALESQVAQLQSNDVSGSTYIVHSFVGFLGASLSGPGNMNAMASWGRTMSFGTDGIVRSQTTKCQNNILIDVQVISLLSTPDCSGSIPDATYTQSGNLVEIHGINGNGDPEIFPFNVSDSGDVLMHTGANDLDSSAFDTAQAFLTVGVRVE